MRNLWALKYTPSPTYTGKRACQHSQNNAVFSPLPAHLTKGLWIVQLAAVWLVPRCYTNEKDIHGNVSLFQSAMTTIWHALLTRPCITLTGWPTCICNSVRQHLFAWTLRLLDTLLLTVPNEAHTFQHTCAWVFKSLHKDTRKITDGGCLIRRCKINIILRLLHKIGNNSYINTAIFSKLHHSYTFIQHYIQIITSRLPKLHLILIYFKLDLELW